MKVHPDDIQDIRDEFFYLNSPDGCYSLDEALVQILERIYNRGYQDAKDDANKAMVLAVREDPNLSLFRYMYR